MFEIKLDIIYISVDKENIFVRIIYIYKIKIINKVVFIIYESNKVVVN